VDRIWNNGKKNLAADANQGSCQCDKWREVTRDGEEGIIGRGWAKKAGGDGRKGDYR
jgi:hypothetical protein